MYEEMDTPITQSIIDTEASICGAILNYPDRAMALLPDYLHPEDFMTQACCHFFKAVCALKKQRKAVDELTIRRQLIQLELTVSEQSFAYMKDVGFTPEFIPRRAQDVYDVSLRFQLKKVCREVLEDEHTPIAEQLHSSAARLNALYTKTSAGALAAPAASFVYEPPKWLLEPYFQRGKGTLIQADPGVGKTAFMCAVTAAVTTGQGFLGLKVQTPGNVVMLSVEDDPGVLRGRLEANGADLSRVFFAGEAYKLSLNSPEIEKLIVTYQAKMIIFDPFQAFLGQKVDLFRANETRPILSALFEMCARHDCACVIIAHLGKNTTGKSAVNQSLGSVDIPGAMRSIIHIVRDPRLDGQLLAVHIKSSNAAKGKSITYSIGKRGGVNWLELTDDTLESVMTIKKEEEKQPYEKNILLPVILHMRDNNRQNCFWSYDEVREVCRQVLQYVPFKDSRTLATLLPKDFLEELERRENIQLRLGERFNAHRGLRLLTMPKAGEGAADETLHLSQSEYEEMMSFLDSQEPQSYL